MKYKKVKKMIRLSWLAAVLFQLFLLIPCRVEADSYRSLWKQLHRMEQADRPASAAAVADRIFQKARDNHDETMACTAFLMRCGLRQQVYPDSFFVDLPRLRTYADQLDDAALKAVCHTVLGEIYWQNRYRGQQTESPYSPSCPMVQWSRSRYEAEALRCFRSAMRHPEFLAACRSRDMAPLLQRGKDSRLFHDDLLHVLLRRILSQVPPAESYQSWRDTLYHQAIHTYRHLRNRPAVLMLLLDSLEDRSQSLYQPPVVLRNGLVQDAVVKASPLARAYEKLLQEYGDIPEAAAIYMAYARLPFTAEEQVRLLQTACRLYPRYGQIAAVRNRLQELQAPFVLIHGQKDLVPGQRELWQMTSRNIRRVTLYFYHLAQSLDPDTLDADQIKVWLAHHATPVDTLCLSPRPAAPWEEVKDTLAVSLDKPGTYLVAWHSEPAEGKKSSLVSYSSFRVSDLTLFLLNAPADSLWEAVVVRADKGTPVPGARVLLTYQQRGTVAQTTDTWTADARGWVRGRYPFRTSARIYAVWGQDSTQALSCYWNPSYREDAARNVSRLFTFLYTDRAVYRPGQDIQVAGLVYRHRNGVYEVVPGYQDTVTLTGAHGLLLDKLPVKTDAWGHWVARFRLPEKILNGNYRLHTPHGTAGIRVESYRRPTFEIQTTPLEQTVYTWDDSLVLQGVVRSYSGIPIAHAAVVPALSWYAMPPLAQMVTEKADTLRTDARGFFRMVLPLQQRALREARLLVRLEAMHPSGERQDGTVSLWVSEHPVHLRIDMPEMLERHHPDSISLRLQDMSGRPCPGTVFYHVYPIREHQVIRTEGLSGKFMANSRWLPVGWLTLPSGRYVCEASSIYQGDTLRASRSFVLFSADDNRVPVDTSFWCHLSAANFSEHPVCLQVGSSLGQVTLHYALSWQGRIQERGQVLLQDTLWQTSWSYRKEYGEALQIHLAFAKGGKNYTRTLTIRKPEPRRQLRYHWRVFRNHLQPGDTVQWQLTVTHADGTPADAALMATLYDAALDQYEKHTWSLPYSGAPDLLRTSWQTPWAFALWLRQYHPIVREPLADEQWTDLQPFLTELWQGRPVYKHFKGLPLSAAGNGADRMLREESSVVATDMMAVKNHTAEVVEPLPAEKAFPATTWRHNFRETAFFFPSLQTDTAGVVHLNFKMPQDLTRWHFMGLLHTSDMASCMVEAETVTSQPFTAHLYLPRFLRRGDRAVIQTVLSCQEKIKDKVRLCLELCDPVTMQVLAQQYQTCCPKEVPTVSLSWDIAVPDSLDAFVCRLTATSGLFTDGEQRLLPVLSDQELVTLSEPFLLAPGQHHMVSEKELLTADLVVGRPDRVVVHYLPDARQAVWQTLPVLQQDEAEDVLSRGAAYFASVTAACLYQKEASLREAACRQRQQDAGVSPQRIPDGQLWQETPWLRPLEQEQERSRQFDTWLLQNSMPAHRQWVLERLLACQTPEGGFAWYPQMPANRQLTCELLVLVGQLYRQATPELASEMSGQGKDAWQRALTYLRQEQKRVKETEKGPLSRQTLDYLEAYTALMPLDSSLTREAVAPWLDRLDQTMAQLPREERIRACLILFRAGYRVLDDTELISFKEYLVGDTLQGFSWKYPSGARRTVRQYLQQHLRLMELFREAAPQEQALLQGMRVWLLRQKRIQGWDDAYLTARAVAALGQDTGGKRMEDSGADTIRWQSDAGKAHELSLPHHEALFRIFTEADQLPRHLEIRHSQTGQAWGSVFRQYLYPISRVPVRASGLHLQRQQTVTQVRQGARLTERYVVTADQDYDFVALRISHPACCEPLERISGYRFQNGLGYYQSIQDASQELFWDHLPQGTYVIEVSYTVSQTGTYQRGTSELYSVYAPEFRVLLPSAILKVTK